MAENFQAGVCGPTWWNPSRGGLGLSSPCSPMLTDHMGTFGWSTEPLLNLKAATSGNSDESGSVVSDHEFYKAPQMDSGGGGSAVFMDSALQMLGIDLSSPSSTTTTTTTTSDWNQQPLLGSGRSESNYSSNPTILQEAEMNSGLNFRQEIGMGCLTPVSGDCTASFPAAMSSAYPTTLLQTLLDNNQQQVPLPQQQLLFDDWSLNYSPSMSYPVNLNELSSPSLRPSIPKQQNLCSWNNNGGSTFVPSAKAQYSASTFEEKRTCPMPSSKVNNTEVAHDKLCSMAKRNSNEPGPTFKRPRIETPSPLPTFKVRKEKLGDRITALQQLVSPFGKTDTASVLQEAIEYIKFLHDQVNVLSTPYMKNGAAQYHQNSSKDSKDPEDPKQDLKSRGLCLVPISSTFPVATETPVDFWTPTFGGSYR